MEVPDRAVRSDFYVSREDHSCTKPVDRIVGSLYAIDDAQFERVLGVMLGPAIIPGNRAGVLPCQNPNFSSCWTNGSAS